MRIVKSWCEGCIYNKPMYGGYKEAGNCCHYLLDTGLRREIAKNGRCLSRTLAEKAKGKKGAKA